VSKKASAEAPAARTTDNGPTEEDTVAEVPSASPGPLAVVASAESPSNEQWVVAARNMGTDPELYLHHTELQAQRAGVLNELNEAMAARQLSDSKLSIEAERNVWLGKQLEEADKALSQNQTERERCAAQLLEWEEVSRQLSSENEQLKHKLDLAEKARQEKQLAEEHELCLENESLKQQNGHLNAKLDEALLGLHSLQEVNERGGKQLWDADTRVDALLHEKDTLAKDLAIEKDARLNLVSQLETVATAKAQAIWDRDEMEMQCKPLQEANREASNRQPEPPPPSCVPAW